MAQAEATKFDEVVAEIYYAIMAEAKDRLLAPVAVAQSTALRLARDPRYAIWENGKDPVNEALRFALQELPKDRG